MYRRLSTHSPNRVIPTYGRAQTPAFACSLMFCSRSYIYPPSHPVYISMCVYVHRGASSLKPDLYQLDALRTRSMHPCPREHCLPVYTHFAHSSKDSHIRSLSHLYRTKSLHIYILCLPKGELALRLSRAQRSSDSRDFFRQYQKSRYHCVTSSILGSRNFH